MQDNHFTYIKNTLENTLLFPINNSKKALIRSSNGDIRFVYHFYVGRHNWKFDNSNKLLDHGFINKKIPNYKTYKNNLIRYTLNRSNIIEKINSIIYPSISNLKHRIPEELW
jgi:hypothetical protein